MASNTDEQTTVEQSLNRARPAKLETEIPWVRSVSKLPEEPHKGDYTVETNVSVVEFDRHVPVLANLGYHVERIGFDPPYGCRFYCTVRGDTQ